MSSTEPWKLVIKASDDLWNARAAMYQAGIEQQLGHALLHPHGRRIALEELRMVPAEIVEVHFERIFDIAASTHGYVGEAREVLARLDSDVQARLFPPSIARRLRETAANLDEDRDGHWEAYRRIAETLEFLGQQEMLDALIAQAALSDDPDVLDVALDYKTGRYHVD